MVSHMNKKKYDCLLFPVVFLLIVAAYFLAPLSGVNIPPPLREVYSFTGIASM